MKIHTKLLRLTLILATLVHANAWAEPFGPSWGTGGTKPVVVIDPGHGGTDEGVKGPDGGLEKVLMLELARKVEARLVPDYVVRLTRDDDYQVSLAARAGIANTSQASLIISLHAGAGFTPRSDATTIYLNSAGLPKPLPETVEGEGPLPEWQWRYQQARHRNESQRLGAFLLERLGAITAVPVVVADAFLPVLAGADTPAVLLEFGDLNGAAGEKRMSAGEWQQRTAGAIATAIRDFLSVDSR
ncbi:MAG: N-acetylmuramoyl-L-alanine amidase [Desulfosarcinaceae bacterium]|nr:N-acetylmuramoyl-L-alanine amidase [Desulfosarcinaceae bacterium]